MPSSRKPEEGGPAQFGRAFREAGPLFGSGIQMAAAIVMMFFAGRWVDGKLGTSPWMMLLGILLGATAGLVHFFRTVIQQNRNDANNSGDRNDGPAR